MLKPPRSGRITVGMEAGEAKLREDNMVTFQMEAEDVLSSSVTFLCPPHSHKVILKGLVR